MEKIKIAKPCTENWELMSPQEKGRFCSVCYKCVIDFTQMPPQEIRQVIGEKQGEKVCGKFYRHQINPAEVSEKYSGRFLRFVPLFIRNNKAALGLFSFILAITGCSKTKENCTPVMGEYVVENEEAPLNDQFVMGKIDGSGIKSDSVAKINNQDRISVKRKTGK